MITIKDALARSFYEIESIKNNWSVRELKRQINSLLFERLALSKDKDKVMQLAQKGQVIEKPEEAIKDPYVLEFLGLPERSYYTESQLEQQLIKYKLYLPTRKELEAEIRKEATRLSLIKSEKSVNEILEKEK